MISFLFPRVADIDFICPRLDAAYIRLKDLKTSKWRRGKEEEKLGERDFLYCMKPANQWGKPPNQEVTNQLARQEQERPFHL